MNRYFSIIYPIYLLIDGISKLKTTFRPQDESHSQGETKDEKESELDASTVASLSSSFVFSQETIPRTPKRTTKFCAKDTPRVGRVQETPNYISSYVKRQRRELIASLGWECFEGTIEYFFEHVLPPLRTDLKVDDIFEGCLKQGLLIAHEEAERYEWSGIPDNPTGRHETEIYNEPLKNILEEITEIAEDLSPILNPLTHKAYFHPDGSKRTWSEKGIASKPDAHVFMVTPDKGYPTGDKHWYNVACSFQFKKADKKDKKYEVLYSIL